MALAAKKRDDGVMTLRVVVRRGDKNSKTASSASPNTGELSCSMSKPLEEAKKGAEDKKVVVVRLHTGELHALLDVGKDLWPGSLFLCDYVMHHPLEFTGSRVLELGCGVGLLGVILSRFTQARRLTLTDCTADVLGLCRENLQAGLSSMGSAGSTSPTPTVIRVWDLFRSAPCRSWAEMGKALLALPDVGGAEWSAEELGCPDGVVPFDTIVCSEMVYDDDLTEALVSTLAILLGASRRPHAPVERKGKGKGKGNENSKGQGQGQGQGQDRDSPVPPRRRARALMAVELRVNFSLQHMTADAHAFRFFELELKRHQLRLNVLYGDGRHGVSPGSRGALSTLPPCTLEEREAGSDVVILEVCAH